MLLLIYFIILFEITEVSRCIRLRFYRFYSIVQLISSVKPHIYCQQTAFWRPELAVVSNYDLKREHYLTATVEVIDHVAV